MQQLSWKNFPAKIEKSLCKLFGLKYAPNPVHNSVTIYSAKALSVFLCVKGASPPLRRGHLIRPLRGHLQLCTPQCEHWGALKGKAYWGALKGEACPSHGRGVFFSRAGDYQIAPIACTFLNTPA